MFTFAPLSNKLRQAKSNCNSPNNICTFLPFSKNKNTVFLHMISRRQTTQRTWKVQNLEQRLNHCGKNCQSAKHKLVDKATTIYPPTPNY